MILRHATMDDADFLLRLRNDPETRAMSGNTDEIRLGQHLLWLEQQIHKERLYVASDSQPVGMGRIDDTCSWETDSEMICELSYTIAPEHRGHGYGTALVRALVEKATRMGYDTISCKIKRENHQSLICAARGGVHAVEFL